MGRLESDHRQTLNTVTTALSAPILRISSPIAGAGSKEVETFIQEAIQLHLQGYEEEGIPTPDSITDVIWVEV